MNCRLLQYLRALGVLLTLTTFQVAAASTIYVYEHADGSRLITDHKRIEPGYRLIKVYGTSPSHGTTSLRYLTPRPVASPYDRMIERTAARFRLDSSLLKAVMHAESAFDSYAISEKGASGLMQLMPATADRYGVQSVFDPQQNLAAGARYLRDLLDQFDGDTRLALAGYNAGENAVTRYRGVPPFAETRHFIRKVLDLHDRYRRLPCADGGVNGCVDRKMLSVTP